MFKMMKNTKSTSLHTLINKGVIGIKLSALATALASVSVTALAQPDGVKREIDPNAPIAALELLESLKQVKPLEFSLPAIEHFTTDNGVPVAFVRTQELPILDVDITFNAGSARDEVIRQDGFGISNMTATMLKGGSKNFDEETFNQQVEQLGLWLSTESFKDMFKVKLRSLSDPKYLASASTLMQDMLAHPRFDESVLKRKKAQLLSELQQNQQYPGYVADLTFMKALYGEHPYAHPSEGTVESIPSISTADLTAFWQTFLVADNAKITMTGDLSLAEAKSFANQLASALPRGSKAAPLPAPAPIKASKRIHVPFDAAQTNVKIGQIGNKRTTSQEGIQQQLNFDIGNEILAGGGFGSRLMKEIRKNSGYTYGIYGNMSAMQAEGPYVIQFSARQEVVDDAIEKTLDIVDETLENGVSEKEFRLTKEKFANSYPKGFASNANINSMVATTSFYDLPDDYLNNYLERLDSADMQDVNQALKDNLDPDKFIIVTVGQED